MDAGHVPLQLFEMVMKWLVSGFANGLNRPARLMRSNQQHRNAQMSTRIFDRRLHDYAGALARVPNFKDGPSRLIEDEFRTHATVGAAQNRSERMLAFCQLMATLSVITRGRRYAALRVHKPIIAS